MWLVVACALAIALTGCASPSPSGPRDGSAAGSGPRFAAGGLDAEEYGASAGYPMGDRCTSWAMGKPVPAMLVGIAIDEGRIRSVDDRAEAYVPALAGAEYGRTSLRHLLQMSSGVRFIEEYSGRDDVTQLSRDTFLQL